MKDGVMRARGLLLRRDLLVIITERVQVEVLFILAMRDITKITVLYHILLPVLLPPLRCKARLYHSMELTRRVKRDLLAPVESFKYFFCYICTPFCLDYMNRQ